MNEWRLVEHAAPNFTVELPGRPNETVGEPGAGSLDLHRAPHAFVLMWTLADAERWFVMQHAAVIGGHEVLEDELVSATERRIVLRRQGGLLVQRIRMLVHAGTGYVLTVSSPSDASAMDAERFLASFVPR